jgi:DNA-binding CsgD family transcriptional regulator
MSDDLARPLTVASRKQVHALWDYLAHFSAADADAACNHLLHTLAGWIDADNAAWIGTARLAKVDARTDPLMGWRTKAILFLHPPQPNELLLVKQALRGHIEEPGMTTAAMARLAGTFRVHRLRDGFVDWTAFKKTPHYFAYYHQLGVNDRIWVGSPISPDAESIFIFDTRGTKSRFTKRHAALAGYVIRGLAWLNIRLMCSHGLSLVESPLTEMERRVTRLLLSDKSEKEIAASLEQSPHTTHGHIKEIYRKFGTQGRAGLMAIWLSNR